MKIYTVFEEYVMDLDTTKAVDLSGQDMSEWDLRGVDMSNWNISGAELCGANLVGAILPMNPQLVDGARLNYTER